MGLFRCMFEGTEGWDGGQSQETGEMEGEVLLHSVIGVTTSTRL